MRREGWLLLLVANRAAFVNFSFYFVLVPYALSVTGISSINSTLWWILATFHVTLYGIGSIMALYTRQIIKQVFAKKQFDHSDPKAGLEVPFLAILLVVFGAWGSIGVFLAIWVSLIL